jgi:hypothetical protein
MKLTFLTLGTILAGLVLSAVPASAHHAWVGYDMNTNTTVQGTVSKFEFINPHVWIYLDVKDAKGNIQKWETGGPSPIRMGGNGWNKNSLKPGDTITVVGNKIEDGTNKIRLDRVIFPDGHQLICYGVPGP